DLVAKRLAKALLATRLRPVADIDHARQDEGGAQADNRDGIIPSGQNLPILRFEHDRKEENHLAESVCHRHVNERLRPPPASPPLPYAPRPRQPDPPLFDAMQRRGVLPPPALHQIVESHDCPSSARFPARADLIRLIFTPTLLSVMPTMAAISL